jgi:hypothetical protein
MEELALFEQHERISKQARVLSEESFCLFSQTLQTMAQMEKRIESLEAEVKELKETAMLTFHG